MRNMQWLKRLAKPAALAALGPLLLAVNVPGLNQRFLIVHNSERASASLPAMRWDGALATDAAEWARHLAATNTFDHFEEVSSDPDAQGENLWMGTRDAFAPETMVGHWIDEKKDFKPGVFPDNSRTGNLEDIGHYTQIMWRDTEHVGCALAKNGESDFLVCRYSTSGNVIGERPF